MSADLGDGSAEVASLPRVDRKASHRPRSWRGSDLDRSTGVTHDRPPVPEALLFLYAPFAVMVVLTFAATADDPFITLRYAANLVHGYGLAFNPGQYVQGFTSPLHLLIAVVAYVLPGGHYLLKLKIASLGFGVLALREASLLIWALTLPLWAKRTAYVAVGSSWVIAFASSNGLETSLVVWLIIALVRRLVVQGPARSPLICAALAFAAVLARLDTAAPLGCMALAGLVAERSFPLWRRVSWAAGAAVGLFGILLGGLAYFGSALPNTFYAKQMPQGRALSSGLHYLIDPFGGQNRLNLRFLFVTAQVILIGLAIVGVAAILLHRGRRLYLVGVVVGQTLFILSSGGDWMTGGRFLAPMAIPAIILAVLGLAAVSDRLHRRARPSSPVTRVAVAIVAAALIGTSLFALIDVAAPAWTIKGVGDGPLIASGHYANFSPMWLAVANDLKCVPSGSLVASSEVGYLGFSRLDLRLLDTRGLTDSYIARRTLAIYKQEPGVTDPNWFNPKSAIGRSILRQQPSVIVSFDGSSPPVILDNEYHVTKVQPFGLFPIVKFYTSGPMGNLCQR